MKTDLQFQENKPLNQVCTFGIGGPARYFATIHTIEEMVLALKKCQQENLRFLILGKGSNCLFDDLGFDGVVLQNKIDFIENFGNKRFHVGAGYSFSLLGVQTARQGFQGLEFASGIPASVGGAVFMNAGANGHETCETLHSVDFVTPDGAIHTLPKDQLHFSYRTSPFQTMPGAIVGATFQLTPSDDARKKQLEIVQYRQKTQPYKDKSAGCVFRNPPGDHAGKLIETCSLKGFGIGDAEVSTMHANFIVNKGKASSKDILQLIRLVREEVKTKTGFDLESEVRIIPFRGENG
jgi:UDP-N-acetylmuramate dehydrogenase